MPEHEGEGLIPIEGFRLLTSNDPVSEDYQFVGDEVDFAEPVRITVNGEPVKASYKVKAGDLVSARLPVEESSELVAEAIPLDVVYEDKALLVVNKLAGMVVHPAPGTPALLRRALPRRPGPDSRPDLLPDPGGRSRPGRRPLAFAAQRPGLEPMARRPLGREAAAGQQGELGVE